MERVEIDASDRRSERVYVAGRADPMSSSNSDALAKAVALKFDNCEATGPIDLESLKALRKFFAPLAVKDATALIRKMRDESDH